LIHSGKKERSFKFVGHILQTCQVGRYVILYKKVNKIRKGNNIFLQVTFVYMSPNERELKHRTAHCFQLRFIG